MDTPAERGIMILEEWKKHLQDTLKAGDVCTDINDACNLGDMILRDWQVSEDTLRKEIKKLNSDWEDMYNSWQESDAQFRQVNCLLEHANDILKCELDQSRKEIEERLGEMNYLQTQLAFAERRIVELEGVLAMKEEGK